ncbi:MAG: molybdopterin molybdotransferase MoeA [bacterium]|nr:molybdopterin molybdotransferase MoeA [bacterium]
MFPHSIWKAGTYQLSQLLNVEDALERILAGLSRLPSETCLLEEALGRVLAADVSADHALPPFANSSMDGYAVRGDDLAEATAEQPVRLTVIGDISAGSAPSFTLQTGQAARIMTGAMLPSGADAVIPVEDTDADWRDGGADSLAGQVAARKSVRSGENVRPVGEDIQPGDHLLSAGTVIRPAALGVLAGLGISAVPVVRRPRVAIVSSGNELLAVDQPLVPGKIRDVNSYTLAGLVTELGATAWRIPPAQDTVDSIRAAFQAAVDWQADLIVSSAGVSVGAVDLVRFVLQAMGEIGFWRVNVRPGKPLAYGSVGSIPFFGLPGNPVSAMVTFDVFVRPALLKMTGRNDQADSISAVLAEPVTSDGRRSYLRVVLERDNGTVTARLTGTQSSGAISSMAKADGLLIIPEGITHAPQGTIFTVRLLKPFA